MSQPDQASSRSKPPRQRPTLFIVGLLGLAAVLLGAFVSCGHGHGFRHRGHGLESPEEAREHIERHADWVLGRVDASEAQQERIVAMLGGSVDELYALRDRHRIHHDELLLLFTAAEIDRAAIETVRAQEVALLDEASAVLTTTLTDVAEVLTPEQRAELGDWADHFHRRR
jgi:Spy/CpxP family protein refolding chaperone